MIDICPMCGSKLEKKDGQVDYFCTNNNCPARNIESLCHFVSRKAMNIDGLGDKIIEDFFNLKYIKNIVDIYKLDQYKEELIELEGYGNKSIDKLLLAIENSKNNSLERLLFGLGIPNVGEKTAKILAMEYSDLDTLIKKEYDELRVINDIGDIIAKSIIDFFKNDNNIKIINELKKIGINTKYLGSKIEKDNNFYNKSFVITGTLSKYTRDEIEELIINLGGKTSSSVSKKTYAVIKGDNGGSKLIKAQELGIKIINEEDLYKMLEK